MIVVGFETVENGGGKTVFPSHLRAFSVTNWLHVTFWLFAAVDQNFTCFLVLLLVLPTELTGKQMFF